jgi:tRNA G18 (ribose-2'-O)-methylase SpoU
VIPPNATTIVALEGIGDVDNVGVMIRNARTLGADAMLLSPDCADPYYRKAIRTSMGHVFTMPMLRSENWLHDLRLLQSQNGYEIIGTALRSDAVNVATYRFAARTVLLFGSEGSGLSAATLALCNGCVKVPMAPGVDSLNVAAAGAVVLYERNRQRQSSDQSYAGIV